MKSPGTSTDHSAVMISELEIMKSAENYRNWIFRRMKGHVGQRIIEIGSGTGNFTRMLLGRELVVALDSSEPCLRLLRQLYPDRRNLVVLSGDIAGADSVTLSRYKPDTVLCVNVLEHIQDDGAALSHMFAILEQGGSLVLLVPAFQFAYGVTDSLVGHHRRYRKRALREKLKAAGFDIEDLFYMNSLALFAWFLKNRIFKSGEHSRAQVVLYDTYIIPWLQAVERIIRPPFGLSLMAIAKKPKS